MTTPEPKPQECWGLYDASGRLHEVWFLDGRFLTVEDSRAGWTIRRVTVTPSDKNGGGG